MIGATSPIGRIGKLTPRVSAQYVRAANATTYTIGDLIGNSTTAANVVPIEFANAVRVQNLSGRITGATCVLTAASGTIVLPEFDLLLFRPTTDIPFAAGSYPADNAALNVSAAAYLQCVGIFTFADDAWRNQAGGATAAGAHVYQAVPATPRTVYPFTLDEVNDQTKLLGLMQAQNAWDPGNVAQTFDFVLDVEWD